MSDPEWLVERKNQQLDLAEKERMIALTKVGPFLEAFKHLPPPSRHVYRPRPEKKKKE